MPWQLADHRMDVDENRESIATAIHRTAEAIDILKGTEVGVLKISKVRESSEVVNPYQLTGREKDLVKQIYPPLSERRLTDVKQKLFKLLANDQEEGATDEQRMTNKQDAMLNGVPDSMVIIIHDNELMSRDHRRIARVDGIRKRPKGTGFDRFSNLAWIDPMYLTATEWLVILPNRKTGSAMSGAVSTDSRSDPSSNVCA